MSPRPAIDHIRKPQILDAAARVITDRGLASTRITDVAARAGTSASALLYWFDNREQLLNEALVADEEAFATAVGERIEGIETAAERLRAVIEATIRDSDLSLWIELWTRSLHDEEAAAARLRLDRDWRDLLTTIIAAGRDAGEFDPTADPRQVALALAALMDGLGVQYTLGDPGVTRPSMLAIVLAAADAALGTSMGAGDGEEVLVA